MSNRNAAIAAMRKAIAGILNIAVEEIDDGAKLALAEVIQRGAGDLRLHISLEPFVILGAVMPADRSGKAVELFKIMEFGPCDGVTN
jgi:hypothetical protein